MLSKLYEKYLKLISEKRYLKYKLNQAINEADKAYMKTNKRHYVVFSSGKYFVVNNDLLDSIKKRNGKKFSSLDILKEAIYTTPRFKS